MEVIILNKVLVKFYIPCLNNSYELFIPNDKKIIDCLSSIEKAIIELSDDYFVFKNAPILVNSENGVIYNINYTFLENSIENGTIITLI